MLDNVERRRFAKDPAREISSPLPVGPLDIELEEGTGQLLLFPRSGPLAGSKANDRILQPDRLAGPHGQVADDSVALVEDSDHRHPLRHRSDPGLIRCLNLCDRLIGRRLLLDGLLAPAAGKQRRQHETTDRYRAHLYSGVQG
jgi:hypothetical protein